MAPPRPLSALATLVPALGLAAAAVSATPPPELNPDPLVAEPLGLRMHLPRGGTAVPQVTGGAVTYGVTAGGDTPWSMRIATLSPAVPDPSVEAMLAERIEAIKATGRRHWILSSGPFTRGTSEGQFLYVSQALDDEKRLVSGWLILPTSSRTFLTFAFLTTAEHFPRLQGPLEASFMTIELINQAQLLDQRQAQIERGRAAVGNFTPQRLRGALSERQWYRLFRPNGPGQPGGATEVGFMIMRCVEAPRGQLTPERSPDSYSALEARRGLMVLLEARVIVDAPKSDYLDLDGRYWMDWDRSTEAWSIRQTRRRGPASQTTAETGVRNLTNLEVIHALKEQFTREPSRWTVPDVAYLTQAEVYLLGSLLPQDGSISGALAFYFYDTKTQQLTRRVDRWTPARDGTGHWVLSTQPMLDVTPITQRFDASGRRVERIDGDGTVTRRIDPADLQRLWQSKGLLTR
jgi:hypothetical protein